MKSSLAILFSLLSISSFAQSNAVTVASIVVPKTADYTSDQYICLGTGWKEANYTVYRLMEDIRTVEPGLFHDLSQDMQNCVIPSEIPYGAQNLFDRLFQHIDDGAKDNLEVALEKNNSMLIVPALSTQIKTEDPAPIFRNQNRSLLRKWARAELLIGTGEIAVMGALLTLPKDFTHWPAGISRAWPNIKTSFKIGPSMDLDPFYMNYLLHPYSGGVYYNALRSQGATRLQSLIFSAVQSTFFEFVVEGSAERPSTQDLIVTPIGGFIVGELSHWATLRMRRHGFTFGEKVLVTLINPTYVLNNGFRR
jgi:hypothetical protein